MKYILVFILSIAAINAKAQFTGTDSLRNYNNRFITNNPATAFTNLRLNTLLRGMIDWIDTARAGTGGGGALGVDTLWALNDSTIRYRKNGVFRNFVLKGVYDTRHKVDTVYKINDTTIGFTINQLSRSITIPGRGVFVDSIYRKAGQDSIFYRIAGVEKAIKDSSGTNIAKSSQTADGNYTQNWAQHPLRIDSIGDTVRLSMFAPQILNPSNNFRFNLSGHNSLVTPFALEWGMTDISGAGGDSAYAGIVSSSLGTTINQFSNYGSRYASIDINGGFNSPHIAIATNDFGAHSNIYMDRSIYLSPKDSTMIKAIPAATADSVLGIRKTRNVFGEPVSTVVKFPIPLGGGATLSNVGSGYRWVKSADGQIKTVIPGDGQLIDSATNTLTIRRDTTGANGTVTRSELKDTTSSLRKKISDTLIYALKSILIPSRLEFIASSDTATYQDDALIGSQIMMLSIESYQVGFTTRSTSVYMSFDATTGTISLTNGEFAAGDQVIIIYRTPPVFLTDGSGNPIRDGSGNFIILN
jgi:hypothetical protein